MLDLGFADVGISSWSEDYAELVPTDLQVTADTAVALSMLLAECRRLLDAEAPDRRAQRYAWRDRLTELHRSTWD